MIPSFIGLIKTGLARSSRFARLGETARGRWSGVLSRHPLTTSTWGLARWSPAALSGRLAGWTARQPWGGGWAEMVYGPRQPRSRRPGRTMRSADRTGADFRATSPLRQAEGDEAPLSWPSWFADESGTEAEETLDLSGPWLTPPAVALPAEPPVERLVAASLERAYQMPGIAWTDVRVTQPTGTPRGPLGPSRVTSEVAGGPLSASRASVERVVRRSATLSTPLPPASAERLWQPAEPVQIPSPRSGNLGEGGATPSFPERLLSPTAASGDRPLVPGEAPGPGSDTTDEGMPGGRPATVIMGGPPSPTRLWQAPAVGLRSPIFSPSAAGELGMVGALPQRQMEPRIGAFVAAPLHPVRLWRSPIQIRGMAPEGAERLLTAGGLVYRQAQLGRATPVSPAGLLGMLPYRETGFRLPPGDMAGTTQQASASSDRPPLAFDATSGLASDAGAASEALAVSPSWSDFAPLPGASRSGSRTARAVQREAAILWPLGEPMTTTRRAMLTAVGTAPEQRPAEGSAVSSSLPTLLTPRRSATLQQATSTEAERDTPAAREVGGQIGSSPTSRIVAPDVAKVQPHPDWPVLARLARLTEPAAAPEPAAFQALRRLAPARAQAALTALASLPTLGGGEPLREEVRRPMETLTRRDLAGVRLHTSPVAETLGAEAFTSGQRVVFAPGRLNLRTPQGIALLGHELSHVGQPLAFKLTSGANPTGDDAEEQAAGQQEDVIRRAVEQGWPEGSRREVRQAARALSAMMEHGGIAQPPGPGGPAAPAAPGAAPSGGGASPGGGSDGAAPVATARLSEATQAGGAAPAAPPNVEALAKQVYSILKDRLRAERERHHVYDR